MHHMELNYPIGHITLQMYHSQFLNYPMGHSKIFQIYNYLTLINNISWHDL
jgi:hypothetical protein